MTGFVAQPFPWKTLHAQLFISYYAPRYIITKCNAQHCFQNILFTSFQGYYSKRYSQHWFLGKQCLTLHSASYSGSHAPKFPSHSHIVFKYYFPKMLCSQYNPQDNITLSPILFPNIILRRGFYIIFWDNMKVAFILYSNITPAVSLVQLL